MKSFLMIAMLLSSPVFALPNVYKCASVDGKTTLNYIVSNNEGNPVLNIKIEGKNVIPGDATKVDFLGVVTESTRLGTLVSGSTYPKLIADAPTTQYSVFIPTFPGDVEVERVVEFNSILLKSSVGGFTPPWYPSERINQTLDLKCTGETLFF